MWGNNNNTYVCRKHNYSRKGYGYCPICREELESLGDKKRIGHCGQFDKVERKTRKFDGQKRLITMGARRRAFRAALAEREKPL